MSVDKEFEQQRAQFKDLNKKTKELLKDVKKVAEYIKGEYASGLGMSYSPRYTQ